MSYGSTTEASMQNVTVIGAGRMGSALATCLASKGFATIVWNRTAAKAEPLTRLGVNVAAELEEAVGRGDVVLVSVSDYRATYEVLERPGVEAALRGRLLVQLSSGMPDDARELASWGRRRGIPFLAGAIIGAPNMIGTPLATILCSGPPEHHDRALPVLTALAANTRHVGADVGHAPALDMAVLAAFTMSAMFGFLQGYLVCAVEGVRTEQLLELTRSRMPGLEQLLIRLFDRLEARDYRGDLGTLEAWTAGPREVADWCRARDADPWLPVAQLAFMERAIRAGKGQADFTYLYELLRPANR